MSARCPSLMRHSQGRMTARGWWFDVKYGNNEDWHDWVKMHLMCGVKTHVVTSVEISRATKHDSPYFKPLLQQTAKAGFKMQEVSAYKGYISAENLQATVDVGATPFIPFKSNTQPDRGSDLWSKMFYYYNYKRKNSWPTITSGQTWKPCFR